MINREFDITYSGFIAYSPDGGYLAYSREILLLQDKLSVRVPELRNEYNDMLSEGGSWVCFIDYLLVHGLQIFFATESAILRCEGKIQNGAFEYCKESKRIWIPGEAPPDEIINRNSINDFLAEKVTNDEMVRNLGG
jgi:hypothetical protein